MRYLQFALAGLLLGTTGAWAVDKFVTPDKLPAVPKQSRPAVQPQEDEPPAAVCQCGCGKTGCTCGKSLTSCTDAVQFDEAALETAMSHKPSVSVAARRTQCLVFTMPSCAPCKIDESDRKPWLTKAGWEESESPNAHFREVDIYKHPALAAKHGVTSCPTYITTVDGLPITTHIGSTPKETLVKDYLEASKLAEANRPVVGAISVGKLTKQQGDYLKKIFGKTGPINIPNEELIFDTGSVKLHVPELFAGTSENVSGKIHAKFKTPIEGKWPTSIATLTQTCDGIVIEGNRVTWELPGYLVPDAVTEIED